MTGPRSRIWLFLWILFWPLSMAFGTPEEARERWSPAVIVSIVVLIAWIVIVIFMTGGEIE